MTSSPLDLDALEALSANATPGPWTRTKPGTDTDGWAQGVAIGATYGRNVFYANPPGGQFPSADADLIVALRNAAPALIAAARKLATYERMDAEAATHVESVICMRTDFAEIDPTESGWMGLGAALNRALDERDNSRAEIARLRMALEAAEEALETISQTRMGCSNYVARDALAKISAALGRESASPAVKAKGGELA